MRGKEGQELGGWNPSGSDREGRCAQKLGAALKEELGTARVVHSDLRVTNTHASPARRRQGHPTPVLLPGECQGWRSPMGCSPWDCEESDMTEQLHFHFSLSLFTFMHWRRQWQPTPVFLPLESQGQRSLVGCNTWDCEELDMTEQLHFHFSLSCIGEGNGNPLQCSCLENPRDGGAWWAAIYGVVQSRT